MSYRRPILKWLGGKYTSLPLILGHLPAGTCLVEPFVGSGIVFLNTDYPRYWLNDANRDLMECYRQLKCRPRLFLEKARSYFRSHYNQKEAYHDLRDHFNELPFGMERAALFVYLNRHGYNGLCRYNREGRYNVPFGSYRAPIFPEERFRYLASKLSRARLTHWPYEKVFEVLLKDPARYPKTVIYADPPYQGLSKTAAFTQYNGTRFKEEDQEKLVQWASLCRLQKWPVLISNHDTAETKRWYQRARCYTQMVSRRVSALVERRSAVREVLAVF